MKALLVILAFFIMLCVGVLASTSKQYMKMLAFSLAIPMVNWSGMSLMLFSDKFYRGTSRGMEISLSFLIAFALLVALALRGKVGKFFADKGSFFFFLYWLLSIPSLMNCESAMYAWFELWKIPMMFMVYRAVREYCIYTRDYLSPIYGFSIVSVINFLTIVYQHFFVHVNQARGVFDHQNSMAMWSVLAGAVFFAAFLNLKKSIAYLVFSACFVFSSIACFRTYSRGSMVALPLALAIVMLISVFRNFHLNQGIRLAFVALVFVLGMALALPKIANRFTHAPSTSARMRVVFAEAASRMIEDHPFAGIGLNNWGIKINPPYQYSQHREEFRMPPDFKDGIVETIYLLVWAECGLPCLLALLALFFWHWAKALWLTKFKRDKDGFWIATGCFAGFTAIYLQSILEWVLKQSINFTQLSICFGIIAALAAIRTQENKELHAELLRARRKERLAYRQSKKADSTEENPVTSDDAPQIDLPNGDTP